MVQSDHWDPSKKRYRGLLDAAAQLRAERGMRGFYKGFSACLLRAFPASAATFATYSVVSTYLQ
jgi:solute carrier family 25 carnitine/acylcarnitine transporter 20/29